MLTEDFCPRCYWHQILLGFHPPFAFPMPGMMHNLDRFEKQIVDAHFAEKEVAPRWLRQLSCVEVVPSSGSPLETDYQYDALGNLVQVDQWGGPYGNSGGNRQRTFIYDSLSRLVSSANPETGQSVTHMT